MAKYCSQDQIEMFSDLLQRTLDIQVIYLTNTRFRYHHCPFKVGNKVSPMSRHASAAGTRWNFIDLKYFSILTRDNNVNVFRFKLLNCGMSLLQGDVLPKSLAKHVLRCLGLKKPNLR